MPKSLLILELAAKEARSAWLWYHARSKRAAGNFRKALEYAVTQIAEQPESFPEYLRGTRFIRLKRFPFIIVFREMETEIQIIAVAHAHRRPGYWKRRLK